MGTRLDGSLVTYLVFGFSPSSTQLSTVRSRESR